jgi:hypothetical protein
MKSIALLGFAFAMSPALVAAQTSPAPEAAAASFPHPNTAQMEQMRAQMEQIHARTRQQMLASLTPAHRAAVANIIGQLAIAPNPNRQAAAAAIDALLSPGERNSVLSVETAAHTQARSLMEASRAQFEASLSADQRAEMQARMDARTDEHRGAMNRTRPAPDAGSVLLRLGGGEEHRGVGGPMGGGPPPQ